MKTNSRWMPGLLCGIALASLFGGTGCQVHAGGQTLPSGYFLQDDVQFYAPGPEFKLAREAAALKAYNAEQQQQQQQGARR